MEVINFDKAYLSTADRMEFMMQFPDNYFSIGITDIPYGIDVANMSFVKERGTSVKQKNGNRLNPNRNKSIMTADWDREVPPVEFWDEFKRITKEQILFGVDYVDWDFGKGRIKWNKGFHENVSFKQFENAYCSFIDYEHQLDCLWAGMMQAKSIKEPMVQQGNKRLNEKRQHPTQKPIILWDLIFLFCLENSIDISKVVDTHLGLSSIILSAMKFDQIKEIRGCDISSSYISKSCLRIKNELSQLKMF